MTEHYGRDTSVRVPLRVCEPCHRRLRSRGTLIVAGVLAGGAILTAGVAVFAGWWAVIPAGVALITAGVVVQSKRRRQRTACRALLTPVPVYAELLATYRFAEVQLPSVG